MLLLKGARLASSLFVLLLQLSTSGQAHAAAPPASAGGRRVSAPFQLPSHLDSHVEDCDNRRPWTRLRDGLIQRVFRLPKHDHEPVSWPRPAVGQKTQRPGPPPGLVARYHGDVVLRFNITSVEEALSLAEATNVLFLDVWESRDDWVDIRLSKDVVPSLLGLLPKSLQHAHTPLMHDLAQAIYESYPSSLILPTTPAPPAQPHNGFSPLLRSSPSSVPNDNLFFRDYQPLSVIVPWMRLLASLFPTHVRLINIGISYEGRDIPALRLGVHPTNSQEPSTPRKTIIVSGGSHAREWISVSTVTYVAYSLITSYGKSASITSLLEQFDFIFIPTLNPDGYVYTWESDRLWRKNRQQTSLRFCRGLDLDRGWGFQWGSSDQHQNSNPCSESYPGSTPFEAHESRVFADWVRNATSPSASSNPIKIVGFLDLHSYSQQILYPFSYTCATAPPALENLEELALGLSKAIRLSQDGRGEAYRVNSACEGTVTSNQDAGKGGKKILHPRMEPGGGSALDWFYHSAGVRYAYQLKLRDTGGYGFLLPRENIVPTGEEALAAVRHLGEWLGGGSGDVLRHESPKSVKKGKPTGEARNDLTVATDDESSGPMEMGWELKRRRR